MLINIVTNLKIVQQIKFSKYFQVNLGFVSTIDKGGRRIYNESDNFSNYYNSTYRTTIYAQGNIGNIRFYVDHYITSEDYLVIYYGDTFEEFIVNFDFIQLNKKGIDSYLGSIIKEIDEEWFLIKIQDNGSGIHEDDMDKIWYYSYTTHPINTTDIIEQTDFSIKSPLSGFGYGLPISEIYINFFNSSSNNIKIDSNNKRTNVYIYLRNIKLTWF